MSKKTIPSSRDDTILSLKVLAKQNEDAKIAARNVLEDLYVEKEKLAETQAKNEALLESIGDGVIATDREGKVILMNKVAEDLLGLKGEGVMGKFFYQVITAQDIEGNKILDKVQPITMALSSGTTTITTTNYYFVHKDGARFPVSITVSPIKLDDQIIGAVEVFRDITKEKELEGAKNEFISIASHQLRTPVSGLSWLTEALQFTSQNLDPKQKTYVKDLAMLANRLIGLVEDLLNLSRIQLKTPLMTEKTAIEISGFIEEFIKEIEPYANSKKHVIVFNQSVSEPITLEINKKSLYNVFQNLVSNAVEYSPENTTVTVNLEKSGDFIKISISNKGPVIPKNEQAHLFERFYRAESSKKIKAEGTGLGLYIIKTIIEEMGGRVGFESPAFVERTSSGKEEGVGTVFWFTIPLPLQRK